MKFTKASRATIVALLVLLLNGSVFGQPMYAPKVVAKKAFLNQTGEITETVLYTTTASGNYRVSIYSDTQMPPGLNAMCPYLVWTDDLNAGQDSGGVACLNTEGTFNQSSLVLRVKAGTPISLYTLTSEPSIPSYNVYITIERL